MKMTVPRLLIPLAVVAVAFGASPAAAQEPAHDLEYNRDVRPVLARACIACHGPRGFGNGPAGFPRLAGQHATYTAKQLEDWRTGIRTNDSSEMMADAVRYLTPSEAKAVSEYIAGLH